jgi:phosphopantetheine--protein transferase-like protein
VAAAFQSLQKEWVPGIDVELIEERDPSFERGYFTENELAQVEKADNRHALLTAIWAVKEAMLKALGIGARVDLRDLDVLREKNDWQVVTKGEALKRAMEIGAGCPEVEVDIEETRVVARVLLPVNPNQASGSKFTDIRENPQQENAQ